MAEHATKGRNLDSNVLLSIVSAGVSLAALIVSIRGCTQSERALEIASVQFDESRQTALVAKTEQQIIDLSPTNPDAHIDTIWFVAPRSIFPHRIRVSGGRLDLTPFLPALYEYLVNRQKVQGSGTFLGFMTVGIELAYTTKAELRGDYQTYVLAFRILNGRLQPEHLSFVGRAASEEQWRHELEASTNQVNVYRIEMISRGAR